jgi:transposase
VTNKDRKALIRAVVEEVQLRKEDRLVSTRVIWKGGAVTERTVALHRLAPPSPTPPDLAELIRELATRHTDAQIARVLVRRGIKTPKKHLSFTAHHVAGLRRSHGIPACAEPTAIDHGDTYTVHQTAKLFGVSTATVYLWLQRGVLTGEQITPGAPWAIRVGQTDRERLAGIAPPGWVTLKKAATELGVSRQTILNWVKAAKIPYIHATNGKRRGLRIDVKSAPTRKQGQLLD